jgi:hypothetical protein
VPNATYYLLDVATDSGFQNVVLGYSNEQVNGTSTSVTGLLSNQKYYVRVRASDGASTSDYSNPEEVTTSLQAPLVLAASSITSTSFTANWRTSNAEFYVVDIATDTTFSNVVKSVATVNTSYPVTGLTTGTPYYIRVMGVTAGVTSAYSNIVKAIPSAVPNQAPVFSNMPSGQIIYLKNGTAYGSAQFMVSDNDGDILQLKAQSSDPSLIDGNTVSFTQQADGVTYIMNFQSNSLREGKIDVTVIADDGKGGIAESETIVTFLLANNQAISFNAFAQPYTYGDANITLSATGGASGNPVTYASSNTAIAQIVNGNEVKIKGAGIVNIIASQSGGNQYNAAADVQQTLTIGKAIITVKVGDETKVYGTSNPPFKISYSGFVNGEDASVLISEAMPQCGADNTTWVGGIAITASSANAVNYDFVYQDGTLTITQANQTITFGAIADQNEGGISFPVNAAIDSNLPIQYTTTSANISIANGQISLLHAGRATITARQPGDSNHLAATSVTQSFCVIPATPVISIVNDNSLQIVLQSSATGGNQWYHEGVLISGATGQELAITSGGTYTVKVQVDDCISLMSVGQTAVVTGIESGGDDIQLYPNPAESRLKIELGDEGDPKTISIYDVAGKQLDSVFSTAKEEELDVKSYSEGLYIIQIKNGTYIKTVRLMKK